MDTFEKRQGQIAAGLPVPFEGGSETVRPRAQVRFGGFSLVKNMRGWHPGMEKRKGDIKTNSEEYFVKSFASLDSGYGARNDNNWNGVHDAATAAAVFGPNRNRIIVRTLQYNDGEDDIYTLNRAWLSFDLSNLSGTVTSVKLRLTKQQNINGAGATGGLTGPEIQIQEWTEGPAITVDDWDAFGGTNFGSASFKDGVVDEYESGDITMTAAGIAYIQSKLGDRADLMLLENEYDAPDIDPNDVELGAYFVGGNAGTLSNPTGDDLFQEDPPDIVPWNLSQRPCLIIEFADADRPSIKNMYHFSKDRVDEKRLLIQMGDGNLVEADYDLPTTGTGFTLKFPGRVPQEIASFSDLNDILLYSNGADQHQIYGGDNRPISTFIYCQDDTPFFPDQSTDFTNNLTDLDPDTFADLPSLLGTAADEAWFIRLDYPPSSLTWILNTFNAASGAFIQMQYWSGASNSWVSLPYTDDSPSGTQLNQSPITWFMEPSVKSRLEDPTNPESPRYLFNEFGWWYKISMSSVTALDAIEVQELTYTTDFTPLFNFWDGIEVDIIEAQVFESATSAYRVFPASTVSFDAYADANVLYTGTIDQAQGLYFDFGDAPDTIGDVSAISVDYWDGSSFQPLTILVDGTNNFQESGWLFWGIPPDDEQKQQFRDTRYFAYWYRINLTIGGGGVLADNTAASILYMPFFDIADYGTIGNVNCAWKDRACWTFKKFPRDIYVSAIGSPNVLNGDDFAILEPGDGRFNKTVSIKKFYNEILVHQKEEGKEGGCTTLFEGFNPSTYGKLILSTFIGSFSEKAVIVVDGSLQSTRRDDTVQTLAYWISHYGIFLTDGRIVTRISQPIQNYFDPRFAECIRQGFEDEMWVQYDSSNMVLRFGLVSGDTATKCNVFPIYDLTDGSWYFDEYANSMSCMTEVEADSGQFFTLQVTGGSIDGYVYRQNFGLNDDGVAIEALVRVELTHAAMLEFNELVLRMQAQSAGTVTLNVYENEQLITDETEPRALDQTTGAAEEAFPFAEAGDAMIRHRELVDHDQESHISVELIQDGLDENFYVYDYMMALNADADR